MVWRDSAPKSMIGTSAGVTAGDVLEMLPDAYALTERP